MRLSLLLALLAASAEAFTCPPTRAATLTHQLEAQVPARSAAVVMGRGDKRTKKGKRKAKSFGVSRPRNAAIRIRQNGPGADLGAAAPAAVAMPPPAAPPKAAPEPEPEPVAEAAPEPAAEPEPAALKPAEIAAKVKELRAELPRAALKECKEAVVASGGDLEAAKATVLADNADKWAKADEEAAEALKAATAAAMDLRDAKNQKKFEKEQAKEEAKAPEPEPEPVAAAEPEPEPEPVAEVAAEAAPPAEAAPSDGQAFTMLKPSAAAAKAGLSPANAILLKPSALASKAGLALL